MEPKDTLPFLNPKSWNIRSKWDFRKKKDEVIKHMVECQPLRVGENECPEQCEMLIPSRPSHSVTTRVILASIFLCFSFSVSWILWLTDIYDNSVLQLVSIRNDIDLIFNLWKQPPTRPVLSIYIFNYTNVNEALSGKEKPNVMEIGPYVFREKMERINIKFHENDTVSFQENRTIEFLPELSYGPLSDVIRIPNIPVLTALKRARSMYYITQKLVSAIMTNLEVEPFQNITVYDFIWGYEDKFFQMVRNVTLFLQQSAPSKFGFLVRRNGVHHHIVTMRTGFPDLDTVGEIVKFDGSEHIGMWGDKCNKVDGSDGTLFPGNKANQHIPLQIFSHDMCRRIPIYFNRTTESEDGFPVVQYDIPKSLFDFSGKTNENKCYNYEGVYPPSGVFNTGPCQNGAPTYTSFPHFLEGDKSLMEKVTGLNPNKEKHTSTFLLHERLGVCLLAKTKFQFNIMLQKAMYIPIFTGIEDGTIFPVAWMDYNSGSLPKHFVNVVYHLTYSVRIVQSVLKWISLLCFLISIFLLYKQIVLYNQESNNFIK